MKPYQTLILLALIMAGAIYLHLSKDRVDPRVNQFVNCYIDLAMLHQYGDTVTVRYAEQKDSVLKANGCTEQSLNSLKAEFDEDPTLTAIIWEKIEKKLQEAKEKSELKE